MSNKISVAALTALLAQMQGVDIMVLARAANLPRENVQSWLAGNKSSLRLQSIVKLTALLGLRIVEGNFRLEPERVHFWALDVKAFGNSEAALAPLMALSKLLQGSAITQILPPGKAKSGLTRTDYYMIGGQDSRVVVAVRRPSFRKARISPEVVKGALWRDDNKHHTMLIPRTHWEHVVAGDLTTKEFDQAFNESMGAMSWEDLPLAARQYNLTPEDLMNWIRERHEPNSPNRAAADADMEVPAGMRRGGVIQLGHAPHGFKRTGTGG